MNSTHYTFDKEFLGKKFYMPTLYNTPALSLALVWEVPSEQHMNLFYNEMQGQISDGMWENSRGTGWLWRHPIIFIQSTRCALYTYGWFSESRRTSFPIKGFLEYDWFLERLPEETGVETFAEAKKIWDEMAAAIKKAMSLGIAGSEASDPAFDTLLWFNKFKDNWKEEQKAKCDTAVKELFLSHPTRIKQSYSSNSFCYNLSEQDSYRFTLDPGRLTSVPNDVDLIKAARILKLEGESKFCSINDLYTVVTLIKQMENYMKYSVLDN